MKAATSGGVPLKVLHVAQTAQGGVGSYLEEIAPLQIERYGRGSVRAVLPLEHAQAFPALSPEWLETFATGTGGRLMTSCRMAWLALRVMREWRPDIVHLHSTFAGLILRPVIRFLPHRPRVVYCPHGWAFDRQARKAAVIAMQGLEWLLAHACDAIVCVSVNDCARARRVGIAAHRLRVVLNGIADLQRPASGLQEAPWPERALRILFVGRLDVQKGVDVLFAAMRKLGDSAFAVVVGSSVVGDGALVGPPPANVRIAGWLSRERIAELYAQAQVLAVPSRWEGLPLVAIEAMRAGLAVVATRVGGLAELVEDGVSGRLIDPDDPEQLARILASSDLAALRAMGAHGRRRYLRDFQVDRVVRELDGLYRDLLGRTAPALATARRAGGQ